MFIIGCGMVWNSMLKVVIVSVYSWLESRFMCIMF